MKNIKEKISEKLGSTGTLLTKVSFIQGLTAIVTFIATILIARLYSREVLGIYSYTFSLAAYLSTLTEFGSKTSLSKLIVIDRNVASDVLKKALIFTVPLSILTAIISLMIADYFGLNPSIQFYSILFISYLTLLTLFSVLLSVLRGFDSFTDSVLFTFLNRFIFLIIIIILSFYTLDPLWIILSLSLSIVILFPVMLKKIKTFMPDISHTITFTKFLKTSVLFLFITVSMFTLYFIDRVILSYISSFSELGYYTAYYNLANIIRILAGLLPIIIIPLAVNKKYNVMKSLKKLTIYTLPITIFIGAISPYIVPLLYGKEYSLQYTDILLPWALVFSSFLLLLYSYFNSILVGENPTSKKLFKIVLIDSLFSLVLPLLFTFISFKWLFLGISSVPIAISLTIVIKLIFNFYYINYMRISG